MTITFREAHHNECSIIANFITLMAEYEQLSDQIQWTEEQLYDELFNKKSANVLFCCIDETIVGFALYFYNFSTFVGRKGLYIEDIFVLENYRNQGIGKLFFKKLATIAIENNCGRMEWVCLNWNTPSINFYKSQNAIAMDDWTTYRLQEEDIKKLAYF